MAISDTDGGPVQGYNANTDCDEVIDAIEDGSLRRLAVDTSASTVGGGAGIGYWTPDLVYEDMNASTGGVARDTAISSTYVDIYNHSGSGRLVGFRFTMETMWSNTWTFRLVIDGNELFTSSGIKSIDISGGNLYGFDNGGEDSSHPNMGITTDGDTLAWHGPLNYPIRFTSSVVIKARWDGGGSGKRFRAGLVLRT